MKSEIDTGGFRVVTGGEIQRGHVIWAHDARDIEFNDARPEHVVSVERHHPDSRGQQFNLLTLEPLQGGHPARAG